MGEHKLVKEGQPTTRTPKGLEIPAISEGDFFKALDKVLGKPKKTPAKPEPSESDPSKR